MNTVKLNQESFELAKALSEFYNAKTRLEVIANSDNIKFESKKMIKDWIRCADRVLREFKMKLPEQWRQIFEQDLLNDEDTGQLDNVMGMLLKLPKVKKNECERYIEQQYDIYARNLKTE